MTICHKTYADLLHSGSSTASGAFRNFAKIRKIAKNEPVELSAILQKFAKSQAPSFWDEEAEDLARDPVYTFFDHLYAEKFYF